MEDKKIKEAFEAWCLNNCNYDTSYSDQTKTRYRSPSTRRAWIVWHAAYSTVIQKIIKGIE